MAVVRRIVDGLTDTELDRICTAAPAPGYPDESRTVGRCLGVVMREECEHRRYAVRDLAVLEARQWFGRRESRGTITSGHLWAEWSLVADHSAHK